VSWLKGPTRIIKWTKKKEKKQLGPFSENSRLKEKVQDSKVWEMTQRTKTLKI
jgi:hypothetical protein